MTEVLKRPRGVSSEYIVRGKEWTYLNNFTLVDGYVAQANNVGTRDSAEHPHTTPIIIALDVTGSMYDTPEHMIKEQFPKLMEKLEQLGVQDPQLLFMAIGDHEYDNYPIQTGQFESDTNKILDSLQSFYLEGRGGPNYGKLKNCRVH